MTSKKITLLIYYLFNSFFYIPILQRREEKNKIMLTYYDHGGYGCVFTDSEDPGYVYKIFHNPEDLNIEFKTMTYYAQNVDLSHQYSMSSFSKSMVKDTEEWLRIKKEIQKNIIKKDEYMKEIWGEFIELYKPAFEEEEKEKDKSKKEKSPEKQNPEKKPPSLWKLRTPFMGTDFEKHIVQDLSTFLDLFFHMDNLFEGLEHFSKQKNLFIHFDLKPLNITYDPTIKKSFFIDLGLSQTRDDINDLYDRTVIKSTSFDQERTNKLKGEDIRRIGQIAASYPWYANDHTLFAKTWKYYIEMKKDELQKEKNGIQSKKDSIEQQMRYIFTRHAFRYTIIYFLNMENDSFKNFIKNRDSEETEKEKSKRVNHFEEKLKKILPSIYQMFFGEKGKFNHESFVDQTMRQQEQLFDEIRSLHLNKNKNHLSIEIDYLRDWFFKNVVHTIDVYGLGMIILFTWKRACVNELTGKNKHNIFSNPNNEKVHIDILNFAYEIIQTDPGKRPSAAQANSDFRRIKNKWYKRFFE